MIVRTLMTASVLALTSACAVTETPTPQLVEDVEPMTVQQKEEIETLNKVASILIDAENLYQKAADIPDNADTRVQTTLDDLAVERGASVKAIQTRVTELGGEADTFGEAIGSAHVGFTYLRTALSNDTEVAMEEVIRGEEYIAKEIEEAMDDVTSQESRSMLVALHEDVRADLAALKELKSRA